MSGTSRFSTHHIPDDGTRFLPGETVRLDLSTPQARIVKDPDGGHEVHGSRQATEYTGGVPLLRVDLRKHDTPPSPPSAPNPADYQAVEGVRLGQKPAADNNFPWSIPARGACSDR